MKVAETRVPGCFEVRPAVHGDSRGAFVKLYQDTLFAERGLPTSFPEWASSRSAKGVVRGLHFQLPPKSQDKLVYCLRGQVMDVVVDLRKGSPAYGQFETFLLDDESLNGVFVPEGCAHGFAALSDVAVISYLMGDEYDGALDAGIRWNSLPIPWPFDDPILSDKDKTLPLFDDFDSPWTWPG